MEVDFQPQMVGRQQELEELQSYLEEASKGKGRAVFIAGEAGVGKSRLVNELIDVAKSRGFKTLLGYSLGESLTPYMPILDALRSGNLESLFAEEAPRVEAVYLVSHSGLLIKNVMRKETELSPDLFASMLSTVSEFVSESLSKFSGEEKEGLLNSLGYDRYQILIETGRLVSLAVILTGQKNEFLINDMREILFDIAKRHGNILENWDGDDSELKGLEDILEPLISSGKYDGVYYGRNDPKARRNLLFENVSLGLIRNSKRTPTLLCVEDLHWADPSTMALMHYIARNTRDTGMLMLGTYRPEDVAVADGRGHPLTDAVQLMDRENLLEMIELSRLPGDRMKEFLDALLGDNDLDDEFREVVYKETEGNPLFIIQLVRYLMEEGVIIDEDGTKRLTRNLEEVDVPNKIYNVIGRRLGRLNKEERRTVDMASVIGGIFTSDVLASALDIEKIQLLENLRILEQTHTLIHSQNGSFRFDHAKVRDVLYDEIPGELRAEHHRIVAQSIEGLNEDDLDEVVGDLAYHYSRSGGKEKAISYLVQAAEKAKKEYSNEEAIRFYSEALEFEEEKGKRLEILVNLGDISRLAGENTKSIDFYEKALELAAEEGTIARIMASIGVVYRLRGEYDDSIRISAEARDMIMNDESKEEAHTLNVLGIGYNLKGEYDKALDSLQMGLVILEKIGDPRAVSISLNNIGNVYNSRGEYNKAIEYYEKALGISGKTDDDQLLALCLNNNGLVHGIRGEYDKALDLFKKGLAIHEKIGDQGGTAICLNGIANVQQIRGEYEKALMVHKKSLRIREKIGDQRGTSLCLNGIGLVHSRRGEYDKALKDHIRALEIAERLDYKDMMIESCIGMSVVNLAEEDLEKALEFGNRACSLSSELGQKDKLGISKCVLGTVYRKQKKWKESIENFERSIEILEEIGANYELAEDYFEFGVMWKEKGDAAKAEACLRESQNLYENLRLDKEVAKVREAVETLRV